MNVDATMITANHELIVNNDEVKMYRGTKIMPLRHANLSPLPVTGG
jgi:hypothetical protein